MDPDVVYAELHSTFAQIIGALVAGQHDTADLDTEHSLSGDAVGLEDLFDKFVDQLDDLRLWLRRGGYPPSNRLVGQ